MNQEHPSNEHWEVVLFDITGKSLARALQTNSEERARDHAQYLNGFKYSQSTFQWKPIRIDQQN